MRVPLSFIRPLGLFAALLSYPFITTAAIVASDFNVFDGALSDLGNRVTSQASSAIFNSALIVNGLLVIALALSLIIGNYVRGKALIWSSSLLISGVFLASVGIHPQDVGFIHFVVSVAFFSTTVIAMLSYGLVRERGTSLPCRLLALLLGLLSIAVWLIDWPWRGIAIQELVNSASASIWLISIVSKCLLHARD